MNRHLQYLFVVVLFFSSSLLAAAPYVQQTSASIDIAGTQVEVPYRVALESTAESDQTQLTATVSVPLDRLLPVLQQAMDQKRPRDNCARHGENLVLATPQLALTLYRGQLRLAASAQAEVWGCVDLFGQDAKTRLLDGTIHAQVLGTWVVEPQALQLKIDLEKADADGNLGEVARVFSQATGESLVETLRRELRGQALPPLPLPQALMDLGGRFNSARFVERDGGIEAEIVLHASLKPADWQKLLSRFFTL